MNEVEAAGNTPLHNAAYEGWLEGVELLLGLGAKTNASNNAGDRPWHWADNMGHESREGAAITGMPWQALQALPILLAQNITGCLTAMQKGAKPEPGQVLVQDHVPKVKVREGAHACPAECAAGNACI